MFGLFCGRTENTPADAKPKEDRGTIARLRGLLGLESGNGEGSGEKSTEEGARRSNQQSKRYNYHSVRHAQVCNRLLHSALVLSSNGINFLSV